MKTPPILTISRNLKTRYTISILTDSNFQEQLKYEQLNDYVISNARVDIENGRKLTKGKLRRLNKQLRIENQSRKTDYTTFSTEVCDRKIPRNRPFLLRENI